MAQKKNPKEALNEQSHSLEITGVFREDDAKTRGSKMCSRATGSKSQIAGGRPEARQGQ